MHVRITSPPVKWPCFYGIDFASRAELIANGLNTEEICRSHRRRLARLHLAWTAWSRPPTVPKDRLCRACFDGVYPIALPDPEHLGKHLLESCRWPPTSTAWPRSPAGAGAADALSRP